MKIAITREGLRARIGGESATPESPVYVFVHGMGGSLHNFEKLQDLASAVRMTVAIELPGHGKSADLDAPWTVDAIVASVQRGLDEIVGNRPVVLVGHSLGVLIAIRVSNLGLLNVIEVKGISGALYTIGELLHHPVRSVFTKPLRKLVLAYATFTASTKPSDKFCDQLDENPRRRIALWPFLSYALTTNTDLVGSSFRDQGGRSAKRLLRLSRSVDVAKTLESSDVPVHFLLGARDPMVPASDRVRATNTFGASRVQIIDGAAHWPQVESPAVVLESLGLSLLVD